jgi:hypothetical protein
MEKPFPGRIVTMSGMDRRLALRGFARSYGDPVAAGDGARTAVEQRAAADRRRCAERT